MLALQSFFTLRHPSLIAVLVVKNMKNNVRLLWGGLLGVSLLWWLSDTAVFDKLPTFFAVRDVFLQYSGIIAISVMSIAMLLAVRPVALESALGGLDKMYRLHKWLGISALVVSASHWLMVKGPKWAVGWGWLERRVRGPRPPLPDGLIVEEDGEASPEQEAAEEEAQEAAPAKAKKKSSAKKAAPAKAAKVVKTNGGAKPGPKGTFEAADKIKVLAKENPYREGTKGAGWFGAYKTGMTVQAAMEAGVPRHHLRFDMKHKNISIA